MSVQSWTPAPKRGIIPFHPLTFGTLLGKPFAALRHNPKVLFGFAVVVQLLVVLITTSIMGAVLVATFFRLSSVSPGSDDFGPILWGSIAINGLAAIAVSFAAVAFTAIMQGVVAAEVRYAVLGEKATLRVLWRQMRPAFWRLVGFSLLQSAAVLGVIAIGVGIVAALMAGGAGSSAEMVAVVVLVILLMLLAMIPLWVWLSTKLLLVPSILVFEHATFKDALVRSWRLTRGRFWVAFGVVFLINSIMGIAMNVVSVPLSLLSTMFGTVIAPTGPNDVSGIAAFLVASLAPQILVFVLQAVTLVVQCTAAAFIYLDCRMRYEGLDQALISHQERRELGWTDDQLADPYAVDPERAVSSAPPPRPAPVYVPVGGYGAAPGHAPGYSSGYAPAYAPGAGYPPGYGSAPGYPPPAYGPESSAPAAPAYPPPSDASPVPTSPAPPVPPASAPSAAPTPPPAPPTDSPWAPPTDSPWAPPGSA